MIKKHPSPLPALVAELDQLLGGQWPEGLRTVISYRPMPLAIGSYDRVAELLPDRTDDLKRWFHRWCNTNVYLRALVNTPMRYDITGQPVEPVDSSHQRWALQLLGHRHQRHRLRIEAEAKAEAEAQAAAEKARAMTAAEAGAYARSVIDAAIQAGKAANADRPKLTLRPIETRP